MVLVFISNLFLLSNPLYISLLIGQVAFYTIGWYGTKKISQGVKVGSIVAIISFFLSMNTALGKGFLLFLKGQKNGGWQRTARQGETK
jgi:hypothetical protein